MIDRAKNAKLFFFFLIEDTAGICFFSSVCHNEIWIRDEINTVSRVPGNPGFILLSLEGMFTKWLLVYILWHFAVLLQRNDLPLYSVSVKA